MIKLFKNFTKRDVFIIILITTLVILSVFFDLRLPEYMSEITRIITTKVTDIKEIFKPGIHMLLCAIASTSSTIFTGYLSSLLSANFSKNIRRKIFSKVESFGLAEIKKFSTSSLITRTTNDVTQIEMLLSMGLLLIIKSPVMAIWALLKIVGKSADLSLITAIGVVIIVCTNTFIIKKVTPRFEKMQKLTDRLNGVTRENLTGIRVIRAFNAEKFQNNRFSQVNEDLTGTQLANQKTFALMSPIMSFVMHFQQLAIYFVGAHLILKLGLFDKINMFSNMVVFSSYGMQVIISFLMLTFIFMIVPRANVSAKRINEILDEKNSITPGNFDGETKDKGIVEFKNVSFKYPDAEEYILKDISFKVNRGETIAFIGSTGSGKSTLINLVPRLYDVTDGEVLIDGVNVKDYDSKALNYKISYVSQKPFMFAASIKDNVAYGRAKKKPSSDKIKEAIRIAQADEFVEKMDKKYDSFIARGGTNISGGQKQRLSIARAIAKDPEIYVFDDAFSALDFKTDARLRKELKNYTKNATIMIVAQRIGTIINADKIVVLDKGKCVGVGTHKELMKKCSVYKEIALSQLSKEELENA